MGKILLLSLVLGFSFLFGSSKLHGGYANYCNGVYWSSNAVAGKTLGKSCIHCRSGQEVKLYVKRLYNGGLKYYYTNMSFVGTGRDNIINRVCR